LAKRKGSAKSLSQKVKSTTEHNKLDKQHWLSYNPRFTKLLSTFKGSLKLKCLTLNTDPSVCHNSFAT